MNQQYILYWLLLLVLPLLVPNNCFAYVGPGAILGVFGPVGAIIGVVLCAFWFALRPFFRKKQVSRTADGGREGGLQEGDDGAQAASKD